LNSRHNSARYEKVLKFTWADAPELQLSFATSRQAFEHLWRPQSAFSNSQFEKREPRPSGKSPVLGFSNWSLVALNWRKSLENGIGNWNWKLELEIGIGNWNWRLGLEIGVGCRFMRRKIGNWSWIPISNSNFQRRALYKIGP
jgi:hypothetical protein